MRIIYFDMDCTRADHLGVYGYNRDTSPVIDKLAEESFVFENCFASDTPCLPSRAALFSCRPGIANGVVSHEWPGCNFRFPGNGKGAHYQEYCMPMRLLQQNGFHTITFAGFAQRHNAWWFNCGFSETSSPQGTMLSERSFTINPRVIKWIKNNIHEKQDLFMHINYMDAHTFYHPDDECRERVSNNPLPDFPDEGLIKNHYENVYGPKTARDIMIRRADDNYKSPSKYMPDEIANREDYKVMLDSYDGSIATADRAIGEIANLLKEEGVYDDTVFIISADHGEAIGQMGMYFEHGLAVDGVAHVPLIIRWPGKTDNGGRFNQMIYQYDFMATLMDLLDIDLPANWDAVSFLPLFQDEDFAGREYLVYGCGIFSLQRSVRTKDYALVKTLHPGTYPLDERYLFNINEDPHQINNLVEEVEKVAEMERLYSDWWNSWCAGADAVVDPMYAQITDFEYFPVEQMYKRLEYVNRDDQIEDLKSRLNSTRRRTKSQPAPNSRF